MFWLFAALFFLIDMGLAPYVSKMTLRGQLATEQAIVFLVAICGLCCAKQPSHRSVSAMTLIVAYTGFSALYFPIWFKLAAAGLCLSVVLWVGSRPESFRSDPQTDENVMLAFYQGEHGSLLMLLFSIVGLPVRSMSIVVGNEWIKLCSGSPIVESVPAEGLDKSKYVLIDTGVKIDDSITNAAAEAVGAPARTEGSLWLRIRCIAAVVPFLKVLGREYVPKWPWECIPSIYFYRCVDRLNRGSK